MPFKLNRYHKNHLFWVYPLIFVGLTIYAIKKDKLDGESGNRTYTDDSIDSSLVRSAKPVLPENLRPMESIDSALIYFVMK
jgi:hypothetical protein